MRVYFALYVILASVPHGIGFDVSIGDLTEVLRFGKETLNDILETWELVRSKSPDLDTNEGFPFSRNMEKRIINQIKEVSSDITKLGQKQESQINYIHDQLLRDIPMQQRLDSRLQDFQRLVYQINNQYQQFVKYSAKPDSFSPYTLQRFAAACVSPDIGQLQDLLKLLHNLIVPQEDDLFENSILVLLSNQLK